MFPGRFEKWPLAWVEMMLPRHLEIIFEINRRLLDQVRGRFPRIWRGAPSSIKLTRIIRPSSPGMAHLAIVGCQSEAWVSGPLAVA